MSANPVRNARKGLPFGIDVWGKNVGLLRVWVIGNEQAGANVKKEEWFLDGKFHEG